MPVWEMRPASRTIEPLGQGDGLHRVVGHQEADAVVAVELAAQLPAGLEAGAGVEGGQGLVEQQQPGLGGQRPGQGDPLGLAAGQLLRLAGPRSSPRPTRSSHSAGPGPGLGLRHAPAAQPEGDVLEGGEVREEEVVLEHDAHRPGLGRDVLAGGRVVEDPPVEHHPALVGRQQPGQDPQQRGLAGAVGPEQRRRPARAGPRARRRVRGCRAGPGPGRSGPARQRSGQDTPSHRSRRPTRTASDTSSSTRLRTIAVSGRDDSSDR